MTEAYIEHANITVRDRFKSAQMLEAIFGWHVRWQGKSASGGDTLHVGNSARSYLAIYTPPSDRGDPVPVNGRLNHIGILVADLDATEDRVRRYGLKPFNHGDYEPGRRFYFYDEDGIEFEVISYAE